MRVLYTLDACMDCVTYIANGDIPSHRPNLTSEIRANLDPSPEGDALAHIVNDNDEEEWFSWSSCECCGSGLGGSRNRLAVLTCEESK